ncbi:MAG: hypothetical protein ACKV2T_28080 [Kofleriaceae bacterium]
MIRATLALVLVAGCNVPAVDYIVTDSALPTTTFRWGLDGYNGTLDTTIDTMSGPRGSDVTLAWTTTNDTHTLIRFDGIFDRLGTSFTVRDAILELNVLGAGSPSGMVYELVGNWNVGTTYNTLGGTPGVQPGEDRSMQQVGLIDGGAQGVTSIRVGASISRWKTNPALNLGWVIIPNDAGTVTVASSDNLSESIRPSLTIIYSE